MQPVIDAIGYSRHADGSLLIILDKNCDRIDVGEAGAGDLLVFWFDRGTREPQHCAILTADGTIIHAYDRKGIRKVVEMTLDKRWKKRIAAAYRIRGLTD